MAICGECGCEFTLPVWSKKNGRGKFCSRVCGARNGQRRRWDQQRKTVRDRYEAMVIRRGSTECWDWNGFKYKGYGRMGHAFGQATIGAHRVSYLLHVGPIPDGLTVLHECDNPSCTNPAHLRLGTNLENNIDRDRKGRGARGERAGRSVLTESDVAEIRKNVAAGQETRTQAASRLGVSLSAVRSAIDRKTWRHIE